MRNKEPFIHNEEMLVNIIGLSFIVMWLNGGVAFIVLMFIYFFFCEWLEHLNYKKTQAKRDEINNRKHY